MHVKIKFPLFGVVSRDAEMAVMILQGNVLGMLMLV
jgi:hypothetical protein